MVRYYEDVDVGAVRDLGSVTLTEEAIVEFGEQWDPMPQHTDPEAAAESLPGALLASGLHTMCISNRLVIESFRANLAWSVGLGFSDVRWPAPVTPGDEVSFRHEVVEKRPSESDPSAGVVTTHITGEVDGKGPVLEYSVVALVHLREKVDGSPAEGE